MLHRMEGVVIKSFDYGEGNKIIKILTEHKKVSLMARGAKKLKSRHTAVAQLFTYAEFVFYQSGKMGTLHNAESMKSYYSLRSDLYNSAYASYLVELVDKVLDEDEGSSYIYKQLLAALDCLEDGKDPLVVIHSFELKMLFVAGYHPVFDRCVSCGLEKDLFLFSAALGGCLCRRCHAHDNYRLPISEKARKVLILLQKLDLSRLGDTKLSLDTKKEIKKLMRTFMDAHIPVRWKSRSFLEQLEKYDLQ